MAIMESLRGALSWLKEAIFPKVCAGCDQEGECMCDRCAHSLKRYSTVGCSICKKGTEQVGYCGDCRAHAPISVLFSAYSFSDPIVKKAVHMLKYGYVSEIAEKMGKNLADLYPRDPQGGIFLDALVIPIPIHKKRLKERGFNQSERIAHFCAETWNIPMEKDVLIRIKHTESQVQLSGDERRKNILGAFDVRDAERIQGKKVFLIDDVYTTGGTLLEAARMLHENGVREVVGITFAREE